VPSAGIVQGAEPWVQAVGTACPPTDPPSRLGIGQPDVFEHCAQVAHTPGLVALLGPVANQASGGALLQRLDPTARRLIWHRYLREDPITTNQVKRVMGVEVEEQERMEGGRRGVHGGA
jgi:hypothetical protein